MNRRARVALIVSWLGAGALTVCADLANPAFEGGVQSNGLPVSWSGAGRVSVAGSAGNRYVVLGEDQAGGLSRIHQTFTLPNPAQPTLTFRYALFSDRVGTSSTVPPDAFAAFLFDPATGARLPSGISNPSFHPTSFARQAFFYVDAEGAPVYDSNFVRVAGPDADGLTAVTLDIASLTAGQSARLEFGLACGANGYGSSVLIDGSAFGCPPPAWLDDGNPCTRDSCDPATGQIAHAPCDPCGVCGEAGGWPADIVVMLDASYSTDQWTDFPRSKQAVRTMLENFEATRAVDLPRVAVGRFNGTTAQINIALTNDYGTIRDQLDGVPYGGSNTPLAAAIQVARGHLEDPSHADPSARRYIVLVTDGWTNRPDDQNECWGSGLPRPLCNTDMDPPPCDDFPNPPEEGFPCLCRCRPAREAAASQAATAKSPEHGIQIYVVHYVGQAENTCTINQGYDHPHIQDAICWLRYNIASHPDFYFFENTGPSGADPIDCQFAAIVHLINCDDGVPCTRDYCEEGLCRHDPSSCP
jgi:hypothetical protein